MGVNELVWPPLLRNPKVVLGFLGRAQMESFGGQLICSVWEGCFFVSFKVGKVILWKHRIRKEKK